MIKVKAEREAKTLPDIEFPPEDFAAVEDC
jgi:hypothetical protein